MSETICSDCRHWKPERGVLICARYALRYPNICTDAVKECDGYEPDGAVSRVRVESDTQTRQVGGDHYVRHSIQPWDIWRE